MSCAFTMCACIGMIVCLFVSRFARIALCIVLRVFFFRSCFVCIVLLLSHCTPHCLERGETPQQLFKRSRAQINSSTTTTHHTQSAVQRLCKRFCRSVELHKKINPLRALEFVVLRLDRWCETIAHTHGGHNSQLLCLRLLSVYQVRQTAYSFYNIPNMSILWYRHI